MIDERLTTLFGYATCYLYLKQYENDEFIEFDPS